MSAENQRHLDLLRLLSDVLGDFNSWLQVDIPHTKAQVASSTMCNVPLLLHEVLYFGECPVNERRDIVVSLHNTHRSRRNCIVLQPRATESNKEPCIPDSKKVDSARNFSKTVKLVVKKSPRLASLDWSIPRVPHMHIEPSSGNLAPQQRMDVIVTYLPKQLGHFQAQLKLNHCHELCARGYSNIG